MRRKSEELENPAIRIELRTPCPNPSCERVNSVNFLLVLRHPSPPLFKEECKFCREEFVIRWMTSDFEMAERLRLELMEFKQKGEEKLERGLAKLNFSFVAPSALLPNERRKPGLGERLRRKIEQRGRRTHGG